MGNNDDGKSLQYFGPEYLNSGGGKEDGMVEQRNISNTKQEDKVSIEQLIHAVGPDLSIPGQQSSPSPESHPVVNQDTHPHLYGQNQLHNGFGPIYAVPSFPWQHTGKDIERNEGNFSDTHPPLFDQNQFHNGFGPVYAIPSYPWQNGVSTESNHWQQVSGYQQSQPMAVVPYYQMFPPCYYGYYPFGFRYN